MDRLNKEFARKMLVYMTEKSMDFETARRFVDHVGIKPETLIERDAFPIIPQIISFLYNPADYGKNGKIAEVEERLTRYYENGHVFACKWSECHARKTGRSDVGKRQEELKTGAGDWLRSFKYFSMHEVVDEYSKRDSIILWSTEYFRIRCTWRQLLEYFDSYNEKGKYQFFKSTVKIDNMTSQTIVMLQEWKTSKKKIAFLQACPYNEE